MKPVIIFLAISAILPCASCNMKRMPLDIQNTSVVVLELMSINDQSSRTTPKAQSHYITDEKVIREISNILSGHYEHLHSGLISSTLPFGFINTYDEDEKQLLVFKLDRILSDQIRAVIDGANMKSVSEADLLLTKISSNKFIVIPEKYPIAMAYRISKMEFDKVVEVYRNNDCY